MYRLPVAALICALAVTVVPVPLTTAGAPTVRTVYVTVADSYGNPLTNLTAEDFRVKEGGRDCVIVSAEPAREKIRLALMVEDLLAAEPVVRLSLVNFVSRVYQIAEVSLIIVKQSGETVVDYTSDVRALLAGLASVNLGSLSQLGMVVEAIDDVARHFERTRPARPAVVLVALEQAQAGTVEPQVVLDRIARSRAQLSVVSVAALGAASTSVRELRDDAARPQVTGDGSRESGGRKILVLALAPVWDALEQIASDLACQYLITYTLPAGVKPSSRLSVTLNALGVSFRAPVRTSNR